MAKLTSGILFTGSRSNISAYTMRGSDKIILRRKGGPSKERVKSHPHFDMVRRYNAEFGGRASATSEILMMLHPHKALADFNLAPAFNKLLTTVQHWDIVSDLGRRNVWLSRNPQILDGFDLNKKNLFSSIIRSPLQFSLSRTSIDAGIEIPALVPGINFFVPVDYPFFRIMATVGVVPDMAYNELMEKYKPVPPYGGMNLFFESSTGWFPCINGSEATALEFTMKELPAGNNWSLMMAIGIQFGEIGADEKPKQAKYAGAAKILAVR